MLMMRFAWGVMITDLPIDPSLMPRIEFSPGGRIVLQLNPDANNVPPDRFLSARLPRNWWFGVFICK